MMDQSPSRAPARRKLWLWLPVVVLAGLFVLFSMGLRREPETVLKSQWIGKPFPAVTLPPSQPDRPGLNTSHWPDRKRHVVNLFASWCGPCAAEAGLLMTLTKQGIAIDGIATRDAPADTAAFLNRYGNPFATIGHDPTSNVQMMIGASGLPETFLIDERGIIVRQYQGALSAEQAQEIARYMKGGAL